MCVGSRTGDLVQSDTLVLWGSSTYLNVSLSWCQTQRWRSCPAFIMPVTLFFSFDSTPAEKLAQAENSYANAARVAWRLNQPNWAACFGHGHWTGAYTHLWSRVAYVLFSLAFVWFGKYNATAFSTWPERTGLLFLNVKELFEHDIDMLIPLNPKLNKHSALRLDKFLSTWLLLFTFLLCLYLKSVTSSVCMFMGLMSCEQSLIPYLS